MLHSVRRVAVSAAAAASSSVQSSPLPRKTASAAAAASGSCSNYLVLPLRPIAHQRRFSSSSSSSSKKPSSPNNGPGRQPVHAGSAAEGDSDASSSKTARGTGAAALEDGAVQKPQRKTRQQKLPSVPSTQHIPAEFIGLSSFFSMHRPMSVTQSLPKTVTDELFASIFAVKPGRKKQRDASEVISTLSQTVDSLESSSSPSAAAAMAEMQQQFEDAEDDGIRKFDITYSSGDKARVVIGMGGNNNLHTASAQFLPYNPPPVPVPSSSTGIADEDASTSAAADSAEDTAAEARPTRRYQAMFTVVETRDPDGQLSAYVHDPQILHEGEGVARNFLERMALRQLRSRMRLRQQRADAATVTADSMLAISVKRQKKLKMKKKKYKKLQRRLKLEKRKLERN